MLSAVLMLFIRTKSKHALSSLPCPPHLILEGRRGLRPLLRPLHLLPLRCLPALLGSMRQAGAQTD